MDFDFLRACPSLLLRKKEGRIDPGIIQIHAPVQVWTRDSPCLSHSAYKLARGNLSADLYIDRVHVTVEAD